jgi:aryl carrier-like protein
MPPNLEQKKFPSTRISKPDSNEDETESVGTLLTIVWCEVFNDSLSSTPVLHSTDLDSLDFFALGGDSIRAMQLVHRAKRAGVLLKLRDVFALRTLGRLIQSAKFGSTRKRGVAAILESSEKNAGSHTRSLNSIPIQVPLSPSQSWFLQQAWPQPSHFNQSCLITFNSPVEEVRLKVFHFPHSLCFVVYVIFCFLQSYLF